MGFSRSTQQRNTCLLVAVLASILSLNAQADDIDVYQSRIAGQLKPNILFVLDYSGSMGWDTSGVDWSTGNGPSRIDTLKSAMEQILESNEGNINAGLGSRFSNSTTGIEWPISDLSASASSIDPAIPGSVTVRDVIQQKIDERGANGATATVDALVEAAQYFRGDPVTHNDSRLAPASRHQPATWDATQNRYTGGNNLASIASSYSPSNAWTSDISQTFYCNDYSGSNGPDFCAGETVTNCVARSASDTTSVGFELTNNLWGDYNRCEYTRTTTWKTPRYNSPITDRCEKQANAIILITDGEPTAINRGATLTNLVGGDLSSCEDISNTIFASSVNTGNEGNCAIEVVRALATQPVSPILTESRVRTYTVGFNINGPGQVFLQRLAQEGRGEFYNAQSPEDLDAALTAAVDDIRSGSESFSELSLEVDKSSFSNGNRAYYSLFTPSVKRGWNGNLKGYFVGPAGLVDINGAAATENNEFREEAQSFWSEQADGSKVNAGGASEQLLTGTRTLYTFPGDTIPASTGVILATSNNTSLRSSNTSITNTMLGLGDDSDSTARRNAALDWIQNAPMGDPLHTKSVSLTYADKKVVYLMTNQGFLHAVDATQPTSTNPVDNTGGEELFAFMPKRLLRNLPDLQVNSNTGGHIYGLDGPMTRWHDDTNNDGIVNGTETAMLYFGMRRGGSAYYAMDVSVPESPVLKWVIDENTTGFSRLAQSWSRMSIIRVKDGTEEKRVLVFGGGFDAATQDDVNAPVESKGNAIYMIDEGGKLLWSVGADDDEEMKYSIASDLTIIDSDNDTLADRLYVGDLGGQLWRVDFGDIDTTPVVTRLADLADSYHQPFFYPPSVSINGERGKRFLAVTIGSGNRTDPLLKGVENNFYMIRDTDVKAGGPADDFSMITVTDLYDATDNDIQSSVKSTADAANSDLEEARGWRVKLDANEKSLSSVLTYEGKVMATTFKAVSDSDNNRDACTFEPTGRFYIMDVIDASILSSSLDDDISDDDDSATGDDASTSDTTQTRVRRGKIINTQGIPSTPAPALTRGSDQVQIFVDKEQVETYARTITRVFWHER